LRISILVRNWNQRIQDERKQEGGCDIHQS